MVVILLKRRSRGRRWSGEWEEEREEERVVGMKGLLVQDHAVTTYHQHSEAGRCCCSVLFGCKQRTRSIA